MNEGTATALYAKAPDQAQYPEAVQRSVAVNDAIADLAHATANLDEAISELNGRITPVLRPDQNVKDITLATDTLGIPLADSINGYTRHLWAAVARIRDLEQRAEV